MYTEVSRVRNITAALHFSPHILNNSLFCFLMLQCLTFSVTFYTLDYLFGKTRDSQGRSKFTQIVDILKQVFSYKDDAKGYDYSGYDLFITGHSLGGGLAQLLAFVLAGSKESKDFVPTPVKAISFASPCVGDKHFYKKYLEFEKEGKLRHLRVSNEGDVVACVPSVGYRQTGLNLHGVPGRMIQVKYRNNKKSSLLQFGLSFVSKHSLNSYSERLFIEC